MRITFVLPAPVRVPMGGAAVVYQHAGRLAALGHDVAVLAPRSVSGGLGAIGRRAAVRARDVLQGVQQADYYVAPGVSARVIPGISDAHVPNGDIVVATGVQTAESVASLATNKGAGCYFIQGDETFVRQDARRSWALPLAKLTCAQWLRREIESAGEEVVAVVPNAVDAGVFQLSVPIAGRDPRVLALYHRHPVKGPDVLIRALEQLRRLRPEVRADVFAARRPSHRLPSWVHLHVRPEAAALNDLYNRSAVLLATSRNEGWGLVPMEAAACGCAVVATENPGIREFLDPSDSVRMVPQEDATALAKAAHNLLDDDASRIALATLAAERVSAFSWDTSTSIMESAFQVLLGEAT